MKAFNALAELVPGLRGRLALLGLAMGVSALSELALVAAMVPLVGIASGRPGYATPGLAVLAFVLANVCGSGARRLNVVLSMDLRHRLSCTLLRTLLSRPYAWLAERHTSDLTKIVVGDAWEVASLFESALSLVCRVLVSLAVTAGLFWLDARVALVCLPTVALLYALSYALIRQRLTRLGQRASVLDAQMQRASLEAFASVKEARSPLRREHFVARLSRPSAERAVVHVDLKLARDLPQIVSETLALACLAGLGAWLLYVGSPVLGTLLVYIVAAWRLIPALHEVYDRWAGLRSTMPRLEHIAELLEYPVPQQSAGEPLPLQRGVRLAVDFSYPGSRAFRFDLEIRRGETVALVGPTGSGKTTCADLLAGLLEPGGGEVRVDDTPLTPELLDRWQMSLGYVPQEVFLLDDTVSANVAFGVEPDLARVANALRRACLEVSPDLLVGERGKRLSGGQRQRLGLARALYHEPQLLILDEATSALDLETERQVLAEVRALRLTVLMITHRASGLEQCDRVYRLA